MTSSLIPQQWLLVALATLAVLTLVSLILVLHSRRQLAAMALELEAQRETLQSLHSGAVGMGQRIMAMEERRSPPKSAAADELVSSRPYTEASHLLALGVSREEVANRCGLSRAETSLLDALRKKPTA